MALEGTHQISVLPYSVVHHPAFLLSHTQPQHQPTLARQCVLLAGAGTRSNTERTLRCMVRAGRNALHVHELSGTHAEGVLREREFVARAAQS